MGALDGRVAVITGAGRGIGRAHARLFAREGAKVVVNDAGRSMDGSGEGDAGPAQAVADEITTEGGQAVASDHDVGDWEGARRLVTTAVDAFGDLHVLVNNAGILRDRMLVNMTEEEWDGVVRVHLKGAFATTRWAAAYWRVQNKAGRQVRASVVNTTSTSGLIGNPGQTNYGAAKAGVAAFTQICAMELQHYGVRCNAIAPAARTRLTEATPGLGDLIQAPEQPDAFDVWDPANVAPVAAYLATAECPLNGRVLFVQGGRVQLFEPWRLGDAIEKDDRWTVTELAREMKALLGE